MTSTNSPTSTTSTPSYSLSGFNPNVSGNHMPEDEELVNYHQTKSAPAESETNTIRISTSEENNRGSIEDRGSIFICYYLLLYICLIKRVNTSVDVNINV